MIYNNWENNVLPFIWGKIMKTYKKKNPEKPILKKVRPLGNLQDVYYTYSHWKSKIVDGIEFIPVTKVDPEKNPMKTNLIYHMRKDNLEVIK